MHVNKVLSCVNIPVLHSSWWNNKQSKTVHAYYKRNITYYFATAATCLRLSTCWRTLVVYEQPYLSGVLGWCWCVFSAGGIYRQLWDSGVALTVPLICLQVGVWLGHLSPCTVSLHVCHALGVIVSNDWCFFFILFILLSLSHAFCVVIYVHSIPLGQSHDQPLNLW